MFLSIKKVIFILNSIACVFYCLVLLPASAFAVEPVAASGEDVCSSIQKAYASSNKSPIVVEKMLYSYAVEQRLVAVKCLADIGDFGFIKPLQDLFTQEYLASPVKPKIIEAIVKLKGAPAKSALMGLLRGQMDAVHSVQETMHPHMLGKENILLRMIMVGLEDYGDKDVADFLLSVAHNVDYKWEDTICESAYTSYLKISSKINQKISIKEQVIFFAHDIQGGNPSVEDFVQGRSGIKKFSAVQEYAARKALISLGLKAVPEIFNMLKPMPASKRKEALTIVMASILANEPNSDDAGVDKPSVVSWLLNEYANMAKTEKFGSHFELLQNLSQLKFQSKDVVIRKLISSSIKENKIDLDELKKKVNDALNAYEQEKLASKPADVKLILENMEKIRQNSNEEGTSFLVDQLTNKDKDVVEKAIVLLHSLAKSTDHRILVLPYVEKIADLTDNMSEEFLVDTAKLLTWADKPELEKKLVIALKDKNATVNKKIVALLVLSHQHNIESLKLVSTLRASLGLGRLRSATDMYLTQFGVDIWMKSDADINAQIDKILKKPNG